MFDKVYLWIQNIAFYMVMVTAVMHMIPNAEYRRYIRFFTGMVLVVMLVAPFLRFLDIGDAWENLYDSREYQEAVRSFEKLDIWEEQQGGTADYPADTQGDEALYTEEAEGSGEIDVEEIRIGR